MSLFFALQPPASVLEQVAAAAAPLRAHAPAARWVPQDDYHITLQFLGRFANVGWVRHTAIAAAAAVSVAAFELSIDRVGAFGGEVLFLAPSPSEELAVLHRALGLALTAAGLGWDDSRTYTPHITLARGVGLIPTPSIRIPWVVNHFALMARHPGADWYSVEHSFPMPA